MKEINTFILLLVGIFLVSCSEGGDQEVLPPISKDSKESRLIHLEFTTTNSASTALNVENFGVYAYANGVLASSASGSVADQSGWNMELPLDEAVTLFAYANADQVILTDSLANAQVRINDLGQNEVYMSELVQAVSDNSMDTVYFELNRLVGQMAFQPTEDETTLNNQEQFDAIDVVFYNVGLGYQPQDNVSVQDTIAIRTTKSEGFKASVFSFPTLTGNPGTIEVIYYKEGQMVNKTTRALDVAVNVEPSKRSVIYMPLLDENYLQNAFGKSDSSSKTTNTSSVTLREFQF